jgi:hypothetical protein
LRRHAVRHAQRGADRGQNARNETVSDHGVLPVFFVAVIIVAIVTLG